MADAVSTTVLMNNNRYYGVHLTNLSDGTGEADVIKIDKSGLLAISGAAPVSLDLVYARWALYGLNYVKLYWEHDAGDVTAMLLTGNGCENFELFGTAKPDTGGATTEGDLKLTTNGHSSGDTYDITLIFKKTPIRLASNSPSTSASSSPSTSPSSSASSSPSSSRSVSSSVSASSSPSSSPSASRSASSSPSSSASSSPSSSKSASASSSPSSSASASSSVSASPSPPG